MCLGITDGDTENQNQNQISEDKKCICKNKNENELFELNKANELCFKSKEVKKITLDNYVIRQNVKKSEPVVYPKQFTFNPRDPSFKHKGLKPKPQSRSQSAEKIRIESKVDSVNEDGDNLKKVTKIEDGENREKMTKDSNEKINNNKKKKKNKKVSFDVTNYIDNI